MTLTYWANSAILDTRCGVLNIFFVKTRSLHQFIMIETAVLNIFFHTFAQLLKNHMVYIFISIYVIYAQI